MDPYIERIFQRLGDNDPITVLESTPRRLELMMDRFFETDFERSYAPDKWSARQIIAHLADTELGLGFRFRQAITVDHYTPDEFDQDAWATRYKRLDAAVAFETFRSLRHWNLALFATFDLEDWGRSIAYPAPGITNVDDMVRFLACHDLNHLQQLEWIVQAL
jgi:hypothetical protein